MTDHPQLEVATREAWRAWLAEHHATAAGVWAVTYKKAAGERYLPYEALVEEALCFGWIDTKGRGLDDLRTQLLLTPRRPGSGWSRPNKQRIERLTAAGLMAPAGIAAVERAKADGSWTALDAIEDLIEPDDLRAALDATEGAREHWDALPPSARKQILGSIASAKRPETRARRIEETARRAAQGMRAPR